MQIFCAHEENWRGNIENCTFLQNAKKNGLTLREDIVRLYGRGYKLHAPYKVTLGEGCVDNLFALYLNVYCIYM